MIERQLAVIPYKNHLLSAVFQGNELYDIIVEPAEAEQTVSYKSTNTSVAAVSGSGVVTAKQTGSSTIIVSNGDLSGAVSVIVNRDTESSVAGSR
mgnify:CR=1 FL=1